MAASGVPNGGSTNVPQTRTAPVPIEANSGRRLGRTRFISVVLTRCNVASSSTVDTPAPTDASVIATSTASSTISTLAIRKL